MATLAKDHGTTDLKAAMAAIVGSAHVRDDADALALFSEDIWSVAEHRVALIVAPGSVAEIQAVVRAATGAGAAIAPRGAGMGYTGSYLPAEAGTVALDMARMNRILAINAADMTVTVEPGVTWAALNAALKAEGLRTPFWGPMSGLTSTIGGGLSQLNAMFGAGQHGTTSESLIALTMVLADGSLLKTGARGPDGDSPFYRHYGPDLAALFCGDSGVFGIKAEITLRLMRLPAHEDYVSFSFPDGASLLAAMAEVARSGIACETCAFDPGLTKVRLKRASLATDVKALSSVIAHEKSLGKGLMAAAKVALGGRNFVEAGDYPLHVIAEGRSAAAVAADIAEARRIAVANGGHEIENTIARMIRSMPFPPLNSMLGPEGEAWAPVHGMVALSQAPRFFAEVSAYFAEMQPVFDAHGIYTGFLFTTVSTNAITIEPVFYWPHGYRPIHASAVEAPHLARLPKLPANPAATAIVGDARRRVVEICESLGGAHFQIGRSYPYRASRDTASKALLDAIKREIDPQGRFNPGGLGFGSNA
ncbi:MAG: FAD-binding oxidoreductase [Alphaproteobacteria bacterium PA4]|nr:MAG: FAD-binding oxidoreductase [Alphaproteobacteria bacterium PA4]